MYLFFYLRICHNCLIFTSLTKHMTPAGNMFLCRTVIALTAFRTGKNVSNMFLNGFKWLFCLFFFFSASCCYGVLSSSCIQLHWLSLLSPFPITSYSQSFKTACLHSSPPNCSPPSVSVSPKFKAFWNLVYNILSHKLLVWLMVERIDRCNLKTRSSETLFRHIHSLS